RPARSRPARRRAQRRDRKKQARANLFYTNPNQGGNHHMLDIRFVRENPDAVKENIKKKFQDDKLPLVDEVLDLDAKLRAAIQEADELRSNRKKLSKQVGALMGQAKKDPSKAAEAEAVKAQVAAQADRLKELEATESELQEKVKKIM